MSEDPRLERRYRRLLALYPAAFLREHGEEMLGVLMSAAAEGQRRPRLAEAGDLLTSAISARARARVRRSWAWETKHRRVMIPVRLAIGTWLLVLTAIFCYFGDFWWLLLVTPAALLHFYIAYRNHRNSLER